MPDTTLTSAELDDNAVAKAMEAFVKDLDTGEPLGPDDPLPNGYRWSDPRLDATVRGEEG